MPTYGFSLVFSVFWPSLTQSSLLAWPSQESSDLGRLEPDGPPVTFGHRTRSPASPPDHPEKPLIWLDSIWIVPFGFHGFHSPWDPPEIKIRTEIALNTVKSLSILFCMIAPLISLFSDYCHFCILILEMYSRYFDPKTGYDIGIFKSVKHHTSQGLPTSVLVWDVIKACYHYM
jgi:hypothetical protein